MSFLARYRLAFLGLAFAMLGACTQTKSPELRVIGVHDAHPHEVVFLQVTNPAHRAMRLTKLEYSFEANHERISTGAVDLSRDVPAGAAIVVEVPFESLEGGAPPAMTLTGKLTAELDRISRTFKVSAAVAPRTAN